MNDPTPSKPLLRVAEALADGAAIEWEDPELDEEARSLRLIERITRAYAAPVEIETRKALEMPAQIGRYPVEGILGMGGMGVVYRGRDPRLDRPVAIKTLPPDVARSTAARRRLEREARLLASVNHPNIATIFGLEEDERGDAFLILELVPGESLSQRLGRGALAVPDALSIAAAVTEALAAAHEAGVVHGDLKPANVMIEPGGRVRVLDFGLAQRLDRPEDALPTAERPGIGGASSSASSSAVVGTPGYIAPERLTGNGDERSDLFSLGCLLYEVLVGSPAFAGPTTDQVLEAVLRTTPDFTRLPAGTPESIRDLIVSCLDRDPARRPDRARAAIEPLGRALGRPAVKPDAPNLPESASPFIGRQRERMECRKLLATFRLVTLTGVGGSGKTRLAIEIARDEAARFPDGVWMADLTRALGADEVLGVVTAAVGDVATPSGESLELGLERHLQVATGLLVIDNAEHVLDRVAALATELLERCPGVTLLVTSRQALGIPAERILRVPALPVPPAGSIPDPASMAQIESIALFVERARQASPGFRLDESNAADVAAIVRQVEGLPLAVALAAARSRVLSPAEIASRLNRPLSLLQTHRPSSQRRHATMRAALAWSADMLAEDEAIAFRRLAVCAGGFDLDAACAVVEVSDSLEMVDTLSRLADKSLIEVLPCPGRPTRYRMLEPVRELARERLTAAGEESDARSHHADYFLAFAETGERGLVSEQAAVWLDRVEDEFANLSTAFDWFADSFSGVEPSLRLAGALWRFGRIRNYRAPCYALVQGALARSSPEDRSWARARALFAAAALWPVRPDVNPAVAALFEEAAQLFAETDDRQGEARALNGAGISWSSELQPDRARPLFERAAALYREIGDVRGLSTVLHNMARDAWLGRDLARAEAVMREALEVSGKFGDEEATARISIGMLQVRLGRLEEARRSLREGMPHLHRMGVRQDHGATAILASAELAEKEGRDEEAARLFGAADTLLALIGMRLIDEDFQWHEHDAAVERLRLRLGGQRLDQLLEAGRSETPEEALTRAETALQSR